MATPAILPLSMKKVLVNDSKSFEIEQEGDAVMVDGAHVKPDLYTISENRYHLILDHKGYQIEVIEKDEQAKSALIMVNGKVYRVELKDEKDRLLETLGFETNVTSLIKDLKAPMPGMVLDILVAAGQQIKKGEPILVLEAMKMENLIKSPSDLVVKSIEVSKGNKIEKGQTLLYFE